MIISLKLVFSVESNLATRSSFHLLESSMVIGMGEFVFLSQKYLSFGVRHLARRSIAYVYKKDSFVNSGNTTNQKISNH